ncbi:CD63 antigen-like [Paramacrobiotus metropolitanus]|uniref:CD63 antigen-like n=1 Tax=Paramacrobiotus metropolitanus TaxID=2943436 RepID=UPI0024464B2F|nr:CD63 antigen-like [Paramacrobiotus metropolitanus]
MLNPDTDEFEVNPFKKPQPQGRLEFYVAPIAHKMGFTSTQFIKWLLVIFNILFFILGLALIGAGAVARVAYKNYITFLDQGYASVPGFMIFVGIVISVVSFLGCCGAMKSHLCFIVTFSIFLGVLFILEISGAIAAYVERNEIQSYLTGFMTESINNNTNPQDINLWYHTQSTLHCCGATSYEDWVNRRHQIPSSCCNIERINLNGTCNLDWNSVAYNGCKPPPTDNNCPIYTKGCANKLRTEVEDHMGAVAGVGLAIAFIQIVGMALSCILAKRIRNGYTYA